VAFVSDLGLTPIYTGKVRDLYEVDEQHLLMVASDRLSAFDVVMAEPIPEKGRVLTGITNFWIQEFGDAVPSSLVSCDPSVIEHSVPGFLAQCEKRRCCRSNASCAAGSPVQRTANTSRAVRSTK
jgi:phosphoribosylaminoimidazole-succinocarboxamide synthase